MDVPAALMLAFPPSAELLMVQALRDVDDEMLVEIARADYGYMSDEMFSELRAIRDTGIIPNPVHWQLGEVLALTRWCNPEQPNLPPFEPGPTGLRGHRTRFFACAVLLQMSANGYDDGSDDSTLALALSSAKRLEDGTNAALGSYLTWRLSDDSRLDGSGLLLYCLALLIASLRIRPARIEAAALDEISEWILAQESQDRRDWRAYFPNSIEPSPRAFSVYQGFWKPLATEIVVAAESMTSTRVRENLQLCAMILET